jgi:uncharacterized repeat protein (TIGR03803 family)
VRQFLQNSALPAAAGCFFSLFRRQRRGFRADVVGDACLDGDQPEPAGSWDKSGHLYGTTQFGGAHDDHGTVFELTP